MLFNLHLYLNSIFSFATWCLKPSACYQHQCLDLQQFSYVVKIFRVENLQQGKLLNYFYLARYFFGFPAKVFFLKRHFVLGRVYYNMEIGFRLPRSQLHGPLTI